MQKKEEKKHAKHVYSVKGIFCFVCPTAAEQDIHVTGHPEVDRSCVVVAFHQARLSLLHPCVKQKLARNPASSAAADVIPEGQVLREGAGAKCMTRVLEAAREPSTGTITKTERTGKEPFS